MSKRLPKRLKELRREVRLVFGRGNYEKAHKHADWCYALELEDRRIDRLRKRGTQ